MFEEKEKEKNMLSFMFVTYISVETGESFVFIIAVVGKLTENIKKITKMKKARTRDDFVLTMTCVLLSF